MFKWVSQRVESFLPKSLLVKNESPCRVITEGQAKIQVVNENQVFYNPIQEFNRDMSLAAISVWGEMYTDPHDSLAPKIKKAHFKSNHSSKPKTLDKGITILEGLAATGLRSIRYAKEIPQTSFKIDKIVANDFDPSAVAAIQRNAAYNQVDHIIEASQGDANYVMYSAAHQDKKFDVIDLDPYGSASPFIDASMQSIADGGLLLVTCTDMAVLAGGQTEACFSKYGSALRSVLHALQTSASRYRKVIIPMMSCSIDFYVRLFVRVCSSAPEVKKAASKTSLIYHCNACKSYQLQPMATYTEKGASIKCGNSHLTVTPQCQECTSRQVVAGPVYGAPIHSIEFVEKMLNHVKLNPGKYKTENRMIGMMTVISEELSTPFYYNISSLANAVHCNTPSLTSFTSALLNINKQTSATHCAPNCVKTDATPTEVWDIMRSWVELHPVKPAKEGDRANELLKKTITTQGIHFEKHKNADPPSRKIRLCRFQENPTANWGPQKRARKGDSGKVLNESNKRIKTN